MMKTRRVFPEAKEELPAPSARPAGLLAGLAGRCGLPRAIPALRGHRHIFPWDLGVWGLSPCPPLFPYRAAVAASRAQGFEMGTRRAGD